MKLTAKTSININAPAKRVWQALTDPELIKQCFYGTEVVSDWKECSPIIYKGIWNDKPYEDKGVIKRLIPEKLFESTYYSPLMGKPDLPENYHKVTYELES